MDTMRAEERTIFATVKEDSIKVSLEFRRLWVHCASVPSVQQPDAPEVPMLHHHHPRSDWVGFLEELGRILTLSLGAGCWVITLET